MCILVETMKINRHPQQQILGERRPWATRAATILCLMLLALVTFVQVTHVHPAATDADHCQICVAMHSAAPVATVAAVVVATGGSTAVTIPVLHTVARPWHCTLFNRPPPANA